MHLHVLYVDRLFHCIYSTIKFYIPETALIMVETEVISNLDSSSVSVIANAWVEVCESDAENKYQKWAKYVHKQKYALYIHFKYSPTVLP